jgi:hypothetical protein
VTLRRVAIAIAIVLFLAFSALIARWLQADAAERAKVERLLAARAGADVEIVRYDSATSRALGAETGPTRVVWRLAGRADSLPTVQCVTVRRTGTFLTGPRVRLLALSAPIDRETSC